MDFYGYGHTQHTPGNSPNAPISDTASPPRSRAASGLALVGL